MESTSKINRLKRKDTIEDKNVKLNSELDNYGTKIIKVIGVFGLIIGILIVVAFWIWNINKLYKL